MEWCLRSEDQGSPSDPKVTSPSLGLHPGGVVEEMKTGLGSECGGQWGWQPDRGELVLGILYGLATWKGCEGFLRQRAKRPNFHQLETLLPVCAHLPYSEGKTTFPQLSPWIRLETLPG